jgi:N6-L-threonylcarbamoyladenine synthase
MSVVLGIESSCDEAAVALVADGRQVLAEDVASLADDMAAWGGVVPELAARGHVAAFPTLIERLLRQAGCQLTDVDVVAVTAWPGLIGSLICGVTAAKVLAARLAVPLVAVHHIQAHLAAAQLGRDDLRYPFLGLVASGGHSHYYRCEAPGQLQLLGGTIDDAAGEAFDKAAAVLELGYPGGPLIDALAAEGNPKAYRLPRSFLRDDTARLSFAGLKTAFLYQLRGPRGEQALQVDAAGKRDAAASFQAAVVDCLVGKLRLLAQQQALRRVVVGGGVACNRGLRAALAICDDLDVILPEPRHCGDNGAMIAALGEHLHQRGEHSSLALAPLPTGKVAAG